MIHLKRNFPKVSIPMSFLLHLGRCGVANYLREKCPHEASITISSRLVQQWVEGLEIETSLLLRSKKVSLSSGKVFTVRSSSTAIYASAALASVITYVVTAFARGTTPSTAQEWITFVLTGLLVTVLAAAIIGSFVVYSGTKKNRTTEAE